MRILIFSIIIIFSQLVWASVEVCSDVIFHGEELKFSETETRMICGDPKVKAYENIPAYEASFFLKGFLQSRGYLEPQFKVIDDVLHVHPGEISYLKKVEVSGKREKLRQSTKNEINRKYQEKILNPKLLDQMESDAMLMARQDGYPCAEISSEAFIKKDQVKLTKEKLKTFKFGEVNREKIKGLNKNALDRFYPFNSNDIFNVDLLTLTEKRMMRAEVIDGTYFLENCDVDKNAFSLSQNFIVGPPRTFRFGAGASTEEGLISRIRWSNNRYGPMASQLSANLQASFRVQSLTLMADNFLWDDFPKQSLLSQFEIIRESQFQYLQTIIRFRPHMKWTQDLGNHHRMFTLGPTFETGTFKADENSQTRTYVTGILEANVQWMSHDYEIFDIHPQRGDMLNLSFNYRDKNTGFLDQLFRLDSSVVKLFNITSAGRGRLISGVRFNAGTALIDDNVEIEKLPPSAKFFGGGSDDIRGFLLRTLPKNDGLGALTRVGGKLELRRTHLQWASLEGFIFMDGAYFGEKSWELEPRLWYSPGIGIRWLSPIGLVQSYAARSYATRPYSDEGNFFYVGLGGTF